MADLNPSAQPTKAPLPRASRRRDKPQLTCTLCRRRKLRCDRAEPCGTCVRRGLSSFCAYVLRPTVVGTGGSSGNHQTTSPIIPASSNITDRIGQLERLVATLIGSSEVAKSREHILSSSSTNLELPATEPDANPLTEDGHTQLSDQHGRIRLGETGTTYVDGTHWTAILDGMAELKDCFQNEPAHGDRTMYPPSFPPANNPEILFGSYQTVTKEEVLATMPPRQIVDTLVAEYFRNRAMAPAILHGPTFMREYEQFWTQPLQTPTMWIGVLLAVMCLAACYRREPAPMLSSPLDLVQVYREKIIQCLILGDYTKCPPYTIETLLLYFHLEYIRNDDTQIETWILLGLIVRLALRTGYHRDAAYFPKISIFQGEMRRRTWALIVQFDTLTSAQVGLPRMIWEGQADTAEPRNLLDEDLNSDMTVLPPSRPDTVHSPMQYTVANNRVVSVYGIILDLVTLTKVPLYSEVVRLDKVLDNSYASIPSGLHMRPMSQSLIDSPNIILRRLYIALLFRKAKCVLHYRYLLASRTDSCYAPSRKTCLEAALLILEYQQILHEETQAGGCLHHDQWKVSSLVTSSFLLATTLICVELEFDISIQPSTEELRTPIDIDLKNKMTQALQKSYTIWVQLSNTSQEAHKAAEVSYIVLNKTQIAKAASSGVDSGEMVNMIGTAQTSKTNSIHMTDGDTAQMARVRKALAWSNKAPTSALPAILRPLDREGDGNAPIDFTDISDQSLKLTPSIEQMLGIPGDFHKLFGFPI